MTGPYRLPYVPPPRLKPHRRYLAYRVYAAVVAVGWNGVVLSQMVATHSSRPPPLMFAGAPLLLPALIMLFSWAAFPWPYSIFGALERTPFPSEPATLMVGPTWARIGQLSLRGPMVVFTVLPSGVGLSIAGGARAFVPRASITGLTGGGFGSSLAHVCAEVRSPIRFRSRELHDAIMAMSCGTTACP